MTALISVFGYGSLVHAGTHDHRLTPATTTGWRRIWREVAGSPHAVLSVTAMPGARFDGVVISVPAAAQAALDQREAMYQRRHCDAGGGALIYEVADYCTPARQPILRSYLDVVLGGYEAVYGAQSLQDFYATTDGWHLDILDDRATPLYPRHQVTTADQIARFDALQRRFGL